MAKFVTLPGILLCLYYAALVKHTTAHCGYQTTRKLAPGEGDRNVSLTVDCRQDNAILTWSNGGLPYLREVTIHSSCIEPTNTSAGAINGTPVYIFFGTRSESDLKQMTVEAFPGRKCSYSGCYERQGRVSYYTFSTVSCAWTEPAGLDMTRTSRPTESSYLLPSSNVLSIIRTSAGLSPSSSYLTPSLSSSAAELPSSSFIPSPTPSVTSYYSTNNPSSSYLMPSSAAGKLHSFGFIPSPTSSVTSYYSTDTLSNGGKYPQSASFIVPLSTSPVFVSSTVFTVSPTLHRPTGVSTPVYVWAVPVVLTVFIIIAVAALMATCITAHKYDKSLPIQKYTVVKGMFNNEEKIDLDFYPVRTCTPTDMISIHSDITVCDRLCKEDKSCKVGIDGEFNLNREECIKEAAGYDVIEQDTTNQSLATSDSGHYVEISKTILETSTPPQSNPVNTLLPAHHTTFDTEPINATGTTETGKPQVSTESDSVQETSFGYVLEEEMPAMKATYQVDHSTIADTYNMHMI